MLKKKDRLLPSSVQHQKQPMKPIDGSAKNAPYDWADPVNLFKLSARSSPGSVLLRLFTLKLQLIAHL